MNLDLDARLTDLVARTAPWLSPLPTAYMTGLSVVRHFGWPLEMGVITGAIVETVGISAVNTALELYTHNRGVSEAKWRAPLPLALLLAGVYFVAVTLLVVLLDVVPQLVQLAPVIFPLLSVTGVTLIAVRIDHRRRVDTMVVSGIPPYKYKRYDVRRRDLLAEMGGNVPEDVGKSGEPVPAVAAPEPARPARDTGTPLNYAEFVARYPDVTGMTGDRVAQLTGVRPRTGRLWLAKRRNGKGERVEVL